MSRSTLIALALLTTGCLATAPEEEPVLEGAPAPLPANASDLQQATERIVALEEALAEALEKLHSTDGDLAQVQDRLADLDAQDDGHSVVAQDLLEDVELLETRLDFEALRLDELEAADQAASSVDAALGEDLSEVGTQLAALQQHVPEIAALQQQVAELEARVDAQDEEVIVIDELAVDFATVCVIPHSNYPAYYLLEGADPNAMILRDGGGQGLSPMLDFWEYSCGDPQFPLPFTPEQLTDGDHVYVRVDEASLSWWALFSE